MMGGAGGGLGWKNNYSVTPGNNYTVKVGDNGINGVYSTGSTSGEDSYFISTSVVKGGSGRYGRYGQATPNSSSKACICSSGTSNTFFCASIVSLLL